MVAEQFSLMPSYVGVTAICDDLKVTCDPQLALPVAEVVQRKMAEAGRGLNLFKCRILIHPDSADLVVWPSTLPPLIYPLLPVVSSGMKLLGAPIGPEIFRQEFVETRVRKVTASVPYLEKLVAEQQFPLMPSFVGVTAVCDDLKVTCDPHSRSWRWSSARWLKPVES